jgi:hypothetical protein
MPKFVKINSLALATGLCLSAGAGTLAAQDSHYWNLQIGTRGMLVGGTLTSGVYDNSAIYYNPAALARVSSSHLTINATGYRVELMTFEDGGGAGIDLQSQRFTTYPQMMSSMITHRPEKRLKISFAMFSRQSAHWDISSFARAQIDILPQQFGQEEYAASFEYQNIVTEPWFGFGGGYEIDEHLSVGVSSFLSYRNQRYLLDISARASTTNLNQPVFVAAHEYHDELRLNNLKSINKIGFHGKWKKLRIGLCATLPSINIAGWSRVNRQIVFQNLAGNQNGVLLDQQRLVPSNYKYPFSLAAGISFDVRRFIFNFNTEYFHHIDPYKMINADNRSIGFPSTLNVMSSNFLSYYNFANQVINFGVSTEMQINQQWTLHTSLRSDQSYHRIRPQGLTEERNQIRSPNFDLYHSTAGASWTRRASVMSFGLNYSLGYNPNARQFVNFATPVYEQLLMGSTTGGHKLVSHSFTIMLGYNYFFALK